MVAQQAEEGLIGISIRDNLIRMTEAVGQSGQIQIRKAARGTARIPFAFEAIEDRSNIRIFAEDLNKIYETSGFGTTRASVSIDSDKVLIKKVPVDASFSGEELQDQVRWEVSQFMINPLDHFIIAHEELAANGDGGEKHVVVVVIRKAVVDFLKEVFAATDLHLRAVDVDVFAAQRVLARTYDFSEGARVALVDLRKKNLQFSVMQKDFYLVQEIDYSEPEGQAEEVDRNEHIARIISKELRRIILDNKLGKSVEDMQDVFIYGDGVDDRTIDILSKSHNVSFHRINPFEKMPLIESPDEPEIREHPESFVTSVGAAIKGL